MNKSENLQDLLSFLDESPTAAYAVTAAAGRLDACGFRRIEETDSWNPSPGEKFYFVRSSSALVAGIAGNGEFGRTGARIIGAHTDFPGFRIKPLPDRSTDGMNTLAVEVYGSPILGTWFDRDLSIAGSLAVLDGSELRRSNFELRGPICRISSPAIHIQRDMNKEGFKVDPEKHTSVILSSTGSGLESLLDLACGSAEVNREDVAGWSMEVYDPQPAVIGGIDGEFVFSGRLDNLQMCHAALSALIAHPGADSTALIALFNSEEIGSRTLNGAASGFLDSVMERMAGSRTDYLNALRCSIMISADGAHGVHPNFPDKHDTGCRPLLGGGPVIKVNVSSRYTSTDLTSAYFSHCAREAGEEVQCFVSRNDMPCGSTIGPILSARTGILSVDVGTALLSMHSVREMCSGEDHGSMVNVLGKHLEGHIRISD